MKCCSLGCQVCLTKSNMIGDLKSHLHTRAHQKNMKEVFQEDMFRGQDFFPYIVFVDRRAKRDFKHPVIGLSLLTLCFSRETQTSFYLCHVCEDKRPADKILSHLFSHDHYSNYFNYTDPNALSFSWMPSMDMKVTLRPQLTKEVNERGSETLQLLALPGSLMKKLDTRTYPEVMHTLSENDKLLKLLEATKPKKMMIQTYQRESTRKHPLLGMQHIVECICVGPTEKRYYLCTLCGITLANHVIIKHILSFDHIFCFFKAWHPSTLLAKECYKDYTESFASMVLDFAKQTEEIHGTADTDMKQVSLEPAKFASVNFKCYTEALTKLASFTKEKNGSSLITSIKPGNRLERRAATAGSVPSYKLCCQDCKLIFETISQYSKHLSERKHKLMLKIFLSNDEKAEGYYLTGWKPTLGLYRYLQESKRQNRPVIGLSLVVACVCTQFQVDPIYVCFACQDCVSESCITQHLKSQRHLIHTLLYQNPWRLPFAWENLDMNVLKSLVLEEEEKRGQDRMVLKILDISYQTFQSLIPPSYQKVIDRLQLQHSLFTHFMHKVPQCETHKLKENERFPLLGKHFMVMHKVSSREHQSTKVGYLCLLCERSLSCGECPAHVFSREHVAKFLDCFHPGSQTSSTDAGTLLDLAKQAAHTHSISTVQVIKLDKPIWEPYTYDRAISILAYVKRRQGGGALTPPKTPLGKLVPRVTLKEEDMDNVIDNRQKNSKTMEDFENITSQKSADNNTPKTTELGSEMIDVRCVKSEENSKKGADQETPTLSDKESERRRALSKTSPDQVKSAGSETSQLIKVEANTEELTPRKPSGKIPESCRNADKGDAAETGKDESSGGKDVLTQLKTYMCKENERKRPYSMVDKSQENTYSDEDEGREMGHKRQRLTSKENTSCEGVQNMPSGGLKGVTTADEGQRGKLSHGTTKDKAYFNKTHQQAAFLWQYVKKERARREPVVGLSQVIECHCDQRDPIYLCECCFLVIKEKNIISHVTGFDHQKMYLVESQNYPNPSGKQRRRKIRFMASENEKLGGCGNAQVVELDEETYNKISKQEFHSAIKTVLALQAQQDNGHELPATAALSGVQPVLASGPAHSQHEVCSVKDNIQVVKNAQSATVVPSKIVTTSKTVGTSQTAATSYSSLTNPNKSMTVMSTCTAKPSSCTTATTKSTATVSRLAATTSSCTTATTNKSTATSSSTTATTTKSIATTTICTATPSKYTAASYKLTGTTSTPSVTISSTTSTMKSSTVSRPLESGTRAGSRSTATSCKAAPASQTRPTVVCEATCRSTPSPTASKVIVTCEATVTSASAATGAKTSVKCENTEASAKTVHMKNAAGANADVAPHIHKSNPPAAPHLTTAMSVRPEDKNPPTEPPDTPTSKTSTRPKVGVNHLIIVLCEQRQQVYCQLCSVKLSQSNHLYTTCHQYNYVKLTYPGWTAKLSESGSKLDRIVALLAEVEKDVGSRAQTLEVTNDVYDEISDLPKDKALERLKTMLRERGSQVSSTTVSEHVGLASPHEVSDDEMYMPKDGPPGLSPSSQPEQENKHPELQKLLSMPEIKSKLKEEAEQSDRAQSWTDKGLEANDLISDQSLSCLRLKSDPDPIPPPSIQDGDIAVTVRPERIEPDVEAQAHVEVTPAIQSPEVEKPLGCAVPPATDSESAGTFSQLPHACEETPESRQQEERSDPDIQATEKTSPVISSSPDPPSSPATVNTEQQNQSKSSLKAEHVLRSCGPRPGQRSTSQELPSIPIGARTQGCSHLSTFLSVKGLDTQPITGLGLVWECRGTPSLESFFLCESCEEMLFIHDICQHMVSLDHHFSYLMKQYTQFLSFWPEEDLPHQVKLDILQDIVRIISKRERDSKMDAQGVLLSQELYENVRRSPFSEAIKIVRNIKEQQQLNVCFLPIGTPQQRGASQKTERHHLEEETAMAGGMDRFKCRKSPLDVTHVSLRVDSVVPPLPGAGACLSSQETRWILTPPVSQHLKPIAEVQVKQAEVHSESQSFCAVGPETADTRSVSPRDACLPTRKRSAETPVETLVTSCTHNAQLEDPLPAKYTRSSLRQQDQPSPEPASGSTSLNPASPEAEAVSATLPSAIINAQSAFGNVAINRNTGQTSQPQGNTQIDTSEVNHLPIIPIITQRPSPTKQKFKGACQGHAMVNTGGEIASPSNTLAAPGAYGQYSQTACVTNEHSGHLSSLAVGGYTIPHNPPVYTGSLYQHQGHAASGFYSSQSYPGQESAWFNLQTFGHSSAVPVPAGWVSMQDQLQLQQYASWTTATSAAAGGKVTTDAAFSGTVSVPAPTNSSQRLMHLNEYAPTQYCNNIIARNASQVCFGPQLFLYPTANAEVQASADSFFASGTAAAPSMANVMPPASQ